MQRGGWEVVKNRKLAVDVDNTYTPREMQAALYDSTVLTSSGLPVVRLEHKRGGVQGFVRYMEEVCVERATGTPGNRSNFEPLSHAVNP